MHVTENIAIQKGTGIQVKEEKKGCTYTYTVIYTYAAESQK